MTVPLKRPSAPVSLALAAAMLLPACATSAAEGERYPSYYSDASANDRRAHHLYSEPVAERRDGTCAEYVRVRSGDTLSEIAEYCDVPVVALMQENRISNPRALEVGDTLTIPNVRGDVWAGTRLDADYGDWSRWDDPAYGGDVDYYTVRRGDTVAEISQRYNVTYRTMARLNPTLEPRALQVGQRIALPDGVTARRAVAERRADAWDDRRDDREEVRRERLADRYEDRRRDYTPAPTPVADRAPVPEHPPYRHDERPMVELTTDAVQVGETVTIEVEDFPAREPVLVMLGQDRNSLREIDRTRTDRYGSLETSVRLNREYSGQNVVIAVRTLSGDKWVISDPYYVASRRGGYTNTGY